MSESHCANCGAVLTGPYCAACGQHAHASARTLGALCGDAWHVITHLDGRFWGTLSAMLLRPGRLTQEYFAEHRARYLPPVRIYLVLSVLFFAVGSVAPRAVTDAGAAALRDPEVAADLSEARRAADAALKRTGTSAALDEREGFGITFDLKDCNRIQSSWRWLEAPLRQACQRSALDGGRAALHAFRANIPKMMFVFLPMMAFVMLLLYWRPRRYYVEHVVFFLHTHAAVFLILLVEALLSGIAAWLPGLRRFVAPLELAGLLYVAWYIYRALRVYYGQSRWLTLGKLSVVGFAYLVFLGITLLTTLIVSALTA